MEDLNYLIDFKKCIVKLNDLNIDQLVQSFLRKRDINNLGELLILGKRGLKREGLTDFHISKIEQEIKNYNYILFYFWSKGLKNNTRVCLEHLPLDSLYLDSKIIEILNNNGIKSVGILINYSDDELKGLRILTSANITKISYAKYVFNINKKDLVSSLLLTDEKVINSPGSSYVINIKNYKINLAKYSIEILNFSDKILYELKSKGINTIADLLQSNMFLNQSGFSFTNSEKAKIINLIWKIKEGQLPSELLDKIKKDYNLKDELEVKEEDTNNKSQQVESEVVDLPLYLEYFKNRKLSMKKEDIDKVFAYLSVVELKELRLSTRAYNSLRQINCNTLADISRLTMDNLKSTRNLGEKSIRELINKYNDFMYFYFKDENNDIKKTQKEQQLSYYETVSVSNLNLNQRTLNLLYDKGIYTISDLLKNNPDSLSDKNISKYIANNVYKAVSDLITDNSILPDMDLNHSQFIDYPSVLLLINPDIEIDMRIIQKIVDSQVSLCDIYIEGPSILVDKEFKLDSIVPIFKGINYLYNNKILKRNSYELLYKKTLKPMSVYKKRISAYDLCDLMDANNKLIDLTKSELGAIELNQSCTYNAYKNGKYSCLDSQIIYSFRCKKADFRISIDGIINHFLVDYDKDIIENSVSKLVKNNLLENNNGIIRYVGVKYVDYARKILDDKYFSILQNIYSGKTLDETGQVVGLTRERVRQLLIKIEKIVSNLKMFDFYEDRYKDIYQLFDWNKLTFIETFQVTEQEYVYLKRQYERGTANQINALYNDYLTDEQKRRFCKFENVLIVGDTVVPFSSTSLLDYVIKTYAVNQISTYDLMDIYLSKLKKYDPKDSLLLEQDKHKVLRCLNEKIARSNVAISSNGSITRYFDYANVPCKALIDLIGILNTFNDGYYSTKLIFDNFPNLVKDIGVLDEYELHNVIRNLCIDKLKKKVTMTKMPHFLVGYNNRDEFLLDKIKELSPISVDDFIHIIYENYGIKEASLKATLSTYYFTYIHNDIISAKSKRITSSDISKLKGLYKFDLYSPVTFKSIAEKAGINFTLSNSNLNGLGYRLRNGNYILREYYQSIPDYIRDISKSEDFFNIEDSMLLNNTNLYNAVNKARNNNMIFKINDYKFLTIHKLNELGISMQDINDFKNSIYDTFSDNEYFSLLNVYEVIDDCIFNDFGFEDDFYVDIINSISGISYTTWNNNYMFSFKNVAVVKNILIDIVSEVKSINIYDLKSLINERYSITIPIDKLKEKLLDADLFYSSQLETVYIDQQMFYEELYGDDE